MLLPPRVDEIVRALWVKNQTLAFGDDDQRRLLTRIITEQICFELGNDWGTKATSSTSPQSKDAIAFRLNGSTMDIWDWQNGTTRLPQTTPNQAPSHPNIAGQFFIQVSPINHLGEIEEPPVPEPPNQSEIIARLDSIDIRLNNLENHIAFIEGQLASIKISQNNIEAKLQLLLDKPDPTVKFPDYEGTNRPFTTLKLHPVK